MEKPNESHESCLMSHWKHWHQVDDEDVLSKDPLEWPLQDFQVSGQHFCKDDRKRVSIRFE